MSPKAVACCLALSWAVATSARAASLRWIVPPECPSQAAIEARLESSIGGRLEEVLGVDFEVTIERRGAHSWRVQLQTAARTPQPDVRARELVGQSCEEVSDAAVVAIAMIVSERRTSDRGQRGDTSVSESGTPPPPEREDAATDGAPAAASVPSAGSMAALDSPPPSAANGTLELSAAALLIVDGALLPSIAPGASLELALRYSSLKLVAFGSLFAEQEQQLDARRGGRFGLALAGGLLCLQPSAEAVLMLGCAGIELGWLAAEGTVASPLRGGTWLQALRIELGGGYRLLPRLAAFGRLGVSAPLTRTEFLVDGVTEVHRLRPFSFRAVAGVELFL